MTYTFSGRVGVAAVLAFATAAAAQERADEYTLFVRPPADDTGALSWLGDVIPFPVGDELAIFYLLEKRPNADAFHPWWRFSTSDFIDFRDDGEAIPVEDPSVQDFCIGTGSVYRTEPAAASWGFGRASDPGADPSVDAIAGAPFQWDGVSPAPTRSAGLHDGAISIEAGPGAQSTRLFAATDALEAAQSFTVSLFINPADLNASVPGKLSLVGVETTIGPAWGLEMLDANIPGSARLNFFVFDADGDVADVQTPAGLFPAEFGNSVDSWRHVAMTYDAVFGTITLWLDGVPYTNDATSLAGGPSYEDADLILGRRTGVFDLPGMAGDYDELRVHNRVLTPEDIDTLRTEPSTQVPRTHWAYYTGFNWQFPDQGLAREGIMRAGSDAADIWVKDGAFETLYAPGGTVFDRDEFRDPFVFFDPTTGVFRMLISTRNRFNGNGVLAEFRSADLERWKPRLDPYLELPAEPIPEVATLLEVDGTWFLVYSRPTQDPTRGTYYRSGPSPDGPWSVRRRLDGRAFYAGSAIRFDGENYLIGWAGTREGETNTGDWLWAGNLVAHRLTVDESGQLSLSVPPEIPGRFTDTKAITPMASSGNVQSSSMNHVLTGAAPDVTLGTLRDTRSISGTLVMSTGVTEAGVFVGGRTHEIVLDPVADQIRFGTESTVNWRLDTDVEYEWRFIIEGSVCVFYIRDPGGSSTALSVRNYEIQGGEWGLFSRNGQASFGSVRDRVPAGAEAPAPTDRWEIRHPAAAGPAYANEIAGAAALVHDPSTALPSLFDPNQVRLETFSDPHTRLFAEAGNARSFAFSVFLDPTDMINFGSIIQKESNAPDAFADFLRVGWKVQHTFSGGIEFAVRGADPDDNGFFGSISVPGSTSGFPAGGDFGDGTLFHVAGGYDHRTGEGALYVTPRFAPSLRGSRALFTRGATQDSSPISLGAARSGADFVTQGAGFDLASLQIYNRLLSEGEFEHLFQDPNAELPSGPANPADVARPYAVHDFFDAAGFQRLGDAADPDADLALPFGVYDWQDLDVFLDIFAR